MNRPLSHSMASHTAKTTVWSSYQKSMIFIPTGFIPMVSIEQVWLSYLCGQQCNLSQLHFETDTHILGRCISCYKNKRGSEYCRLAQQHKAIRATAWCECEQNGNSVTKCQQELHCDGENTFYMNKVTSTGSEIPQCCLGLQCLQMKCYSSRPGEMNVNRVHGALQWPQLGRLVSTIHSTDRMWIHNSLRKAEQHTVKGERSNEDGRKTLHIPFCMVTRL